MVKQDTDYYKRVQKQFLPFSDNLVVKKFDKLLRENIINYFLLSANAYGFNFNSNELTPTNVYNFPAKGIGSYSITVNPIITHLNDIQDFAKKTNYRKFYKDNLKYYDSLKSQYINYATIAEQKKWLEARFDYTINSYRVLTSPLIAGMNTTHTFTDNDFREILLFLPTILENKEWSKDFQKAINTRIIFTEIDHNYVGPVSEQYIERLNSIFSDRTKWVNSNNKTTDHYPTPIKVFDEYLTWGLFILYSYDNIKDNPKLLQEVIININDMMLKKGFPKAEEFNNTLFNLYKNGRYQKIEYLYAPLLDWCENQ